MKKKLTHGEADKKKTKTIPFDFVLEALLPADPLVRPMFGGYALYVKTKIMLMLRRKEGSSADNGVWIATTYDHHESLRKDFPSMRSITVFGGEESGWQVLPEESDAFEEEALKACRLILKGDLRIGKVPKPKKKKKKGE